MKRGTVQLRLCRLEEQMRELRAESDFQFLQVATMEEFDRMLELLSKPEKTGGKSVVKISPEETPEVFALFETVAKRYTAMLGQE